MYYKEWELIYKKILCEFNFSIEADQISADFLDNILKKNNSYNVKKLEDVIKNREVVVFGAGPSLEKSIIKHKNFFVEKIKIAADGATTALLKNNILPDIIVTDLDGGVVDQIKANNKGSIIVVHAHGDNLDKIKRYVPKFRGPLVGTTQTNPKNYSKLSNFGGFTDGDRAVYLADHFQAKKIYLVGFDFNKKIGKYSFPSKKDKKVKLKKIEWCKTLLDKIKNTQYL
ncbi:MAG: DUF115 domain-containing protein [Candidatus Thermoplasmatota archaeon]|jgi:uncharacterized Rossmann fold enzyme|nr:DUF115 domain-containing protein [Candidatus Thermoplasmatota archaeon]